MVTLINGFSVEETTVATVTFSLDQLWGSGPAGATAVIELARYCRVYGTPDMISAASQQLLRGSALLEARVGIHVHTDIQHIVLAAVTGDGLDATLGSPLK